MTNFPNYRIYFMKDNVGNMNEIWKTNSVIDDKDDYVVKTIEEAIEFQKENPKKIISITSSDPKEIVDYLKNNNAIISN